jgi:hypothetical protein
MDSIRLYHQDHLSVMKELCFDDGQWHPGFQFPITLPPHTRSAAVTFHNYAQIRLYVQDATMNIVEWSYDAQGWRSTGFCTAALPYTDVAAAVEMLNGGPCIWLYFRGVQGVLQERFCVEVNQQAKWSDPRDVYIGV